jgi:tetratricopeptide (TPR) repeat protein
MNPATERRAARRRLMAEWAARAQRLLGTETEAARIEAQPPRASAPAQGSETARAGEATAQPRRLPFELLPEAAGGLGALQEPLEVQAAAAGTSQERDEREMLRQAARDAAEQRDWARAGELYRQLLEADPGDVKARNNLALVLEAAGDHDGALAELDRCLALAPSSPDVLINRSAVLGSLGHYAEAERTLAVVLEQDPANADAYFNLGVVTSRRGRWREAVGYLRRAVELDGGRAAAHFYLGEALNKVDDLAGALQAYQRAAELHPTHARAWYGMGIVLDRMNRPEEAAPLYRRSRELSRR